MFQFRLTIPPIPLLSPTQSPLILRREVNQEIAGLVDTLANDVRAHTNVGATGQARAAIATRVTLATDATHLARGEVYADLQRAPHWPSLEEGRRPGTMPPWGEGSSLRLWAQRVLGDARLAFVLARAIGRRGTRAQHVFRNAWARVLPTIQPRINTAVARAVQLLQGGQ